MNASSGATNGIARINDPEFPWRCMMRQPDKWNEGKPNDATMHNHLDNNKHRNKVAWLNASTRMDDGPHPAQFQPATTPVNLVAPRMHLQLNVSLGGKAQANAIAELMQAAIAEKDISRRPCRTSPPSTSPDLASLGVKSTSSVLCLCYSRLAVMRCNRNYLWL